MFARLSLWEFLRNIKFILIFFSLEHSTHVLTQVHEYISSSKRGNQYLGITEKVTFLTIQREQDGEEEERVLREIIQATTEVNRSYCNDGGDKGLKLNF